MKNIFQHNNLSLKNQWEMESLYIGDHGIILKIGNEEIHPRSEHCTLDDPDYIDGILEKPESEAACFGNEKLSMRSVFDCKVVKIDGIFFKEYYICKDKIYAFRAHDSRSKIYEVFYAFDGHPKNKNIFEKILKTFHLTQITN